MTDMQAVREALSRRRSVNPSYFPVYPGGQKRYDEDCQLLASYADSLTDPTPLTVERLVEAGFELDGPNYRCGNLLVDLTPGVWLWFCCDGDDRHLQIPPRTVGELRQLLLRIGEKS